MAAIATISKAELTHDLSTVAHKRIYFGHQSVGANILDGIREIAGLNPESNLKVVSSTDPAGIAGPGLFESPVGENGDPASKNQAFTLVLEKGFGAQGGIALYKYCYVDISGHTDVPRLFAAYRENIDKVKNKYPSLKIIHVTIPLTTVEPAGKAWLKSILGRQTAREANIRRNQFNQLLRETYRTDAIFDLAEAESTHADGSRSFFRSGSEVVYDLCPEYTTDGGHLNAEGRRRAAEKLIDILARV